MAMRRVECGSAFFLARGKGGGLDEENLSMEDWWESREKGGGFGKKAVVPLVCSFHALFSVSMIESISVSIIFIRSSCQSRYIFYNSCGFLPPANEDTMGSGSAGFMCEIEAALPFSNFCALHFKSLGIKVQRYEYVCEVGVRLTLRRGFYG